MYTVLILFDLILYVHSTIFQLCGTGHCFNSLCIVSYSFKGVYMHSDGFTQVFVQYLFFNMGQVKLSMNKYLMAIYSSQGKYKLLPFSHLCMST